MAGSSSHSQNQQREREAAGKRDREGGKGEEAGMEERCRDGCRTFLVIAGVVFVPAIFHTLLPPNRPYITMNFIEMIFPPKSNEIMKCMFFQVSQTLPSRYVCETSFDVAHCLLMCYVTCKQQPTPSPYITIGKCICKQRKCACR